jgi:hypothetical protein
VERTLPMLKNIKLPQESEIKDDLDDDEEVVVYKYLMLDITPISI